MGKPRNGVSPLQSSEGLEDARGSQHEASASSVSTQVDDDGANPPRQRLEIQRVGTVPKGGELTTVSWLDLR
jgi:hypothetical protein